MQLLARPSTSDDINQKRWWGSFLWRSCCPLHKGKDLIPSATGANFCGLSESKWHTRDCQDGRTPRTQPAEGTAESINPFLSFPVFKVAQDNWAVAAWLFIPPPCCGSPGSWHCHFTGRAPEGKAFLETELRFWSSLLDNWDWEPHCAKNENYSLWLAFPLISCSYTQQHRRADQIFLLRHERADRVAANTAPPWECLGGMRISSWGGI